MRPGSPAPPPPVWPALVPPVSPALTASSRPLRPEPSGRGRAAGVRMPRRSRLNPVLPLRPRSAAQAIRVRAVSPAAARDSRCARFGCTLKVWTFPRCAGWTRPAGRPSSCSIRPGCPPRRRLSAARTPRRWSTPSAAWWCGERRCWAWRARFGVALAAARGDDVARAAEQIGQARPTAVNLGWGARPRAGRLPPGAAARPRGCRGFRTDRVSCCPGRGQADCRRGCRG